jgi:hypothetical protein
VAEGRQTVALAGLGITLAKRSLRSYGRLSADMTPRHELNHLIEFYREIVEAKLDPDKVISDVLFEANKDLDHNIDRDIHQDQWEPIVLRALQVAAETLADDPGAKGRVSKMQSRLSSAIDHRALRHEMRQKAANRSKPKKNALDDVH